MVPDFVIRVFSHRHIAGRFMFLRYWILRDV